MGSSHTFAARLQDLPIMHRMLTWMQLQTLCQKELRYDAPQLLPSFKSGLRWWNLPSDEDPSPSTGADLDGFFTVGRKGKKTKRRFEDLVFDWLKGDPVGDWRNGRVVAQTPVPTSHQAGRSQIPNVGE